MHQLRGSHAVARLDTGPLARQMNTIYRTVVTLSDMSMNRQRITKENKQEHSLEPYTKLCRMKDNGQLEVHLLFLIDRCDEKIVEDIFNVLIITNCMQR